MTKCLEGGRAADCTGLVDRSLTIAAGKELLDRVQGKLSDAEKQLFELRSPGGGLGRDCQAAGRRMPLARARD